jgi:hypothetical protein
MDAESIELEEKLFRRELLAQDQNVGENPPKANNFRIINFDWSLQQKHFKGILLWTCHQILKKTWSGPIADFHIYPVK